MIKCKMGTKNKKILEEIHPLNIIREVEKWPVLYVRDSPERANLHFKQKIWNEIGKALFTDWDNYNEREKETIVTGLMRKWRNLRDTFKRQVEADKRIKEGFENKRKTYVYFKHMQYLLPHVSQSEPIDTASEPNLNEYFTRQARKRVVKADKKILKKKKRINLPDPITSVIIPDMPSDKDDIDEDKHFLMSLIPSFKKMNDDEKLEAKVEILKVIKGIRKKGISVESNSITDSLSYSLDESELGEVKVEAIHETEDFDGQGNDFESGDD